MQLCTSLTVYLLMRWISVSRVDSSRCFCWSFMSEAESKMRGEGEKKSKIDLETKPYYSFQQDTKRFSKEIFPIRWTFETVI